MEGDGNSQSRLLTVVLKSTKICMHLSLKPKFYFAVMNGIYSVYKFDVKNCDWKKSLLFNVVTKEWRGTCPESP